MTREAPAPTHSQPDLRADDLLAGLSQSRHLLVAVSGGPDSMALLALAADWSRAPGRPALSAATFDHGFRDASRDEALLAAEACGRLGVPHAILDWPGDRPATRIQEIARLKRYEALVAHGVSIGASHLLTAHHADDQAETILFRLSRGSGVAGLAGMKDLRPRGALLHARPLLHIAKADLLAYCLAHDIPFVTDPSNDDPRFARTRMRDHLAALAPAGIDAQSLARLAGRARRAEEALAYGADALWRSLDVARTDDALTFDAATLADVPSELVLRVLAAAIRDFGGDPRLESVEHLADVFTAHLRNHEALRTNLGGVLLDLGSGGRLRLTREPPRRQARPFDRPADS